ncbi:MAG: hydrolase [Gammaproteobacteria bacterium]
MTTPFKPHPLLANRHLQTIWPSLFRPRPETPLTMERLDLPDGDFVDLAWSDNQSDSLVIFLHGLEGDLHSHYARTLIQAVSNAGHRVVFMHFRGCSGEANRLPRGYHSGDTDDLRHLIHVLTEREQPRQLQAFGISLGGNVLLKYLGEEGDQCPLAAAIAISVPFDLKVAAITLQSGTARIYQKHLLDKLKKSSGRKLARGDLPLNAEELDRVATIYEFDDRITAPLHGFSSAEDYYQQSSSARFVAEIRTPSTIIHAADDPFMTPEVVPTWKQLPSCCQLQLTPRGGHVGFLEGSLGKVEYWLDRVVPEALLSA